MHFEKASKQPTDQSETLSSDKYFAELEKWLKDAYMWQGVAASFPYFLMCNQYMSQQQYTPSNNNMQTAEEVIAHNLNLYNRRPQNLRQNLNIYGHGVECKIPALWKRLLAEFLDFLILFIVKLAVTWIAIDFFEIIDLAKFDLDGLQLDMKKMDYRVALQMTHNIMILEVAHRIVVCFFETFWLIGGNPGRIGGATPGKSMMGLRVVRCEFVTPVANSDERIMVYPGTDLGLGWAFVRSFIKNLVLALFIPFIVAFYYFPNNRSGYDMICSTIVVEEPIVPYRPDPFQRREPL